jgi:ubiquinone/menaquinone biosynthesis C-methylase UbiE
METSFWDKKASDYDNQLKKAKDLYLEVIDLIKQEINKSQILLDIGTGTGEIPIAISDKAGKIIATDFSPEMIKIANQKLEKLNIDNLTFQVQDCYNLSFSDEMFDVIIVANLLHFLDRSEDFLRSLKRFLKKDGKIIIPTFLLNENFKTKIWTKILKLNKYPVNTRFDSKNIIDFIAKCDYNLEKSIFIKSTIPMLFVVLTKKTNESITSSVI